MKTRVQQLLKLPDAVLVEMYRRRDDDSADAFEALVNPHLAIAYRILYKKFHNREEAEEALQAFLLKVMEKILEGKYVDMGKFAAWFFTLAYGEAADTLRLRKNIPQPVAMIEEFDYRIGIDTKINLFETNHDFQKILSSMPENYREVFELFYKHGMSVKEISKLLNKNEGTTSSLNSRAKNYIRAFYLPSNRKQDNV